MKRLGIVYIAIALFFLFAGKSFAADESGATIRIEYFSGQIPVGESFRLVTRRDNGAYKLIQRGEIPASGVIPLDTESLPNEAERVYVWLGRDRLEAGYIEYNPANPVQGYAVTVPPGEGDTAPDIAFKDLFGDEAGALAELRGEVVFLDFWASWCMPCQEPMAHNQAALEANAKAWDGKAQIVAITLDDEAQTAREHVNKKGWTAMHHVYPAGETLAWNSAAAKTYGIWSIPTGILIDPEGKILWRGNPNSANVETLINEALASAH